MDNGKGLRALIGLKVVCCGALLLVASGAVAAAQLGLGAAALLLGAGFVWFLRHRIACARQTACRRQPDAVERAAVSHAAAGYQQVGRLSADA